MLKNILIFLIVLAHIKATAQVTYPYPLHYFQWKVENKIASVAYMDVKPSSSNGKTIILFHGKNFNGYYWKDIIPVLVAKGYRVIAPDQLGWGRSDKPNLHYSFHMLAAGNKSLLDSLHVEKVIVIGHSMGGMLGIRFALMYPQSVEKLVLEDPIGLEDYKTFVPYQPIEKLYLKERSATYESYKKYQEGYYPVWKPEYEQYVKAQAEVLTDPGFDSIAMINTITYQMIYEQPVIYEVKNIAVPTLLMIGMEDRTIVGKELLSEEQKNKYGQYQQLGRKVSRDISNCKLVEFPAVGHIPHIQEKENFLRALFQFL
ncbi:MAG: alpha/beta hydrolase [Ferruginibacter sp.]